MLRALTMNSQKIGILFIFIFPDDNIPQGLRYADKTLLNEWGDYENQTDGDKVHTRVLSMDLEANYLGPNPVSSRTICGKNYLTSSRF